MVGFKQRLAERIIEARESKGWNQNDLAYHAGTSKRTIERLEQAKVDAPRGSTLSRIAEATDRTVEDLRPDMDTEERNLRAQLDRVEGMLLALLSRNGAPAEQLEGEIRQAVEQARQRADDSGSAGRGRDSAGR